MASRSANEDVISISNRRMSSDNGALKTQDRNLVIATWNVRTLYQARKLDNAIQEMKMMKIDILGIAETRWTESGKIRKESYNIALRWTGTQKWSRNTNEEQYCKINQGILANI